MGHVHSRCFAFSILRQVYHNQTIIAINEKEEAVEGSAEELLRDKAKPTVKQHLAAIRMFLDWFVTDQVIDINPAASVLGPKYVVKKGKTHVLDAADARTLDAIDLGKIEKIII